MSVTTRGANGPNRPTHPAAATLGEAHEVRLEPGENRLAVDTVVPYGQSSHMPVVTMGPIFVLEQSPAQAASPSPFPRMPAPSMYRWQE